MAPPPLRPTRSSRPRHSADRPHRAAISPGWPSESPSRSLSPSSSRTSSSFRATSTTASTAPPFCLCAGWTLDTGQSLRELVSRRVILAVGLGLLAAAASVAIVLATEDVSSGPEGIELAGAVVWRGLFYGAVDGLLLTAFPIIVVFAFLSESRLRRRKGGFAAVAAIALAASLVFTATYHLGYSDFRSAKVRKPVAGDLIWAAPVIATANPIGAPIAHAGLHVAAVTHSYETDLFLPPH